MGKSSMYLQNVFQYISQNLMENVWSASLQLHQRTQIVYGFHSAVHFSHGQATQIILLILEIIFMTPQILGFI